jgi:hypothetical protein
MLAQRRGRLDEAQAYFEDALAIAVETQSAKLEESVRDNLAEIVSLRDAHEESEN